MEWLKTIGWIGFSFFLIKGILWLGLFAAIYLGLIKKETFEKIKSKMKRKKIKH